MKEKKNEGITLIALVITIIVLLILAGVTLSTLFGNNGILTESKLAVESNKEANAREQVQLAWAGVETEYQAALTKDSTKTRGDYFNNTNLNKNLGTGNINLTQFEENGKSIVEYVDESNTKYTYEIVNGQVYSDGTAPEVVDSGSLAGTLTKTVEAKNYGDFINYNVDLNGDGNTTNDWKIFYNDGENVFIIASDVLPENKIPSISTMTKNGNQVYWNDTVKNNSGASGIDTKVAEKFKLSWLNNHADANHIGIKAVEDLLNTDLWSAFAAGIDGAQAIGGPTVEMWIDVWNIRHPEYKLFFNIGESHNSDGSVYVNNWYGDHDYEEYDANLGYLLGTSTSQYGIGNWYLNLGQDAGFVRNNNIRFKDDFLHIGETGNFYWLSSPSSGYDGLDATLVIASKDYIRNSETTVEEYDANKERLEYEFEPVFEWSILGGNVSTYRADVGLRPVVCLPSTVNATKSGAIWNLEN